MAKLTDPVDGTKSDDSGEEGIFSEPEVDENALSENEIGSLPDKIVRAKDPFDGYPMARKVKVGEVMVSATYIVILKNPDDVFQDQSGQGVSHEFFAKNKSGEDIRIEDADGKLKKPKVEKRTTVNLQTYHNRVTVHPITGNATDTVFDRKVMVGNRERLCAIIPSHVARAQICLMLDKRGTMQIDRRYELADQKQGSRLQDVFRQANYQQMKAERMAQKFDQEPGLAG